MILSHQSLQVVVVATSGNATMLFRFLLLAFKLVLTIGCTCSVRNNSPFDIFLERAWLIQ